MYRNGNDYDKTARLVIDIYLDYGIAEFPVNAYKICNMLGITLLPYSAFPNDVIEIFRKKSEDSFYVPMTKGTLPKIYYNDAVVSKSRKRYSIFHEVKHFVNSDNSENMYDEDMADYFAKYFMCPIPYLVYNDITDTNEIISKFNVSYSVACSVSSNVITDNRYLTTKNR